MLPTHLYDECIRSEPGELPTSVTFADAQQIWNILDDFFSTQQSDTDPSTPSRFIFPVDLPTLAARFPFLFLVPPNAMSTNIANLRRMLGPLGALIAASIDPSILTLTPTLIQSHCTGLAAATGYPRDLIPFLLVRNPLLLSTPPVRVERAVRALRSAVTDLRTGGPAITSSLHTQVRRVFQIAGSDAEPFAALTEVPAAALPLLSSGAAVAAGLASKALSDDRASSSTSPHTRLLTLTPSSEAPGPTECAISALHEIAAVMAPASPSSPQFLPTPTSLDPSSLTHHCVAAVPLLLTADPATIRGALAALAFHIYALTSLGLRPFVRGLDWTRPTRPSSSAPRPYPLSALEPLLPSVLLGCGTTGIGALVTGFLTTASPRSPTPDPLPSPQDSAKATARAAALGSLALRFIRAPQLPPDVPIPLIIAAAACASTSLGALPLTLRLVRACPAFLCLGAPHMALTLTTLSAILSPSGALRSIFAAPGLLLLTGHQLLAWWHRGVQVVAAALDAFASNELGTRIAVRDQGGLIVSIPEDPDTAREYLRRHGRAPDGALPPTQHTLTHEEAELAYRVLRLLVVRTSKGLFLSPGAWNAVRTALVAANLTPAPDFPLPSTSTQGPVLSFPLALLRASNRGTVWALSAFWGSSPSHRRRRRRPVSRPSPPTHLLSTPSGTLLAVAAASLRSFALLSPPLLAHAARIPDPHPRPYDDATGYAPHREMAMLAHALSVLAPLTSCAPLGLQPHYQGRNLPPSPGPDPLVLSPSSPDDSAPSDPTPALLTDVLRSLQPPWIVGPKHTSHSPSQTDSDATNSGETSQAQRFSWTSASPSRQSEARNVARGEAALSPSSAPEDFVIDSALRHVPASAVLSATSRTPSSSEDPPVRIPAGTLWISAQGAPPLPVYIRDTSHIALSPREYDAAIHLDRFFAGSRTPDGKGTVGADPRSPTSSPIYLHPCRQLSVPVSIQPRPFSRFYPRLPPHPIRPRDASSAISWYKRSAPPDASAFVTALGTKMFS